MRRYIDMVRRQPNNPHAIYIACKYLQPEDLKQFIAMVGVPLWEVNGNGQISSLDREGG